MLTVDRIEGEVIICEENGILLELSPEQISGEIQEGDILLPMKDGRFSADAAATQQRRTKMSTRFASLRKKK